MYLIDWWWVRWSSQQTIRTPEACKSLAMVRVVRATLVSEANCSDRARWTLWVLPRGHAGAPNQEFGKVVSMVCVSLEEPTALHSHRPESLCLLTLLCARSDTRSSVCSASQCDDDGTCMQVPAPKKRVDNTWAARGGTHALISLDHRSFTATRSGLIPFSTALMSMVARFWELRSLNLPDV